jgi:hypothetical protein
MTATLLDSLVLRHKISNRPGAFEQSHAIFQGLMKIATVSPSTGLLARGVHPDGVTYWGNPSVDQYTGAIFGLWRYHRSHLATVEERAQIRTAIGDMLRRFERDQWMILDENGDTTNVWDLGYLDPTRAERLLSFLLAAWDVTGDRHWLDVYELKKKRRLPLCRNFDIQNAAGQRYPSWVQEQTAMSLRMLLDLARDPSDLAVYREGARTSVESAIAASPGIVRGGKNIDLAAIFTVLVLEQKQYYSQAIDSYRDLIAKTEFTRRRTPPEFFEYLYYMAVDRGLLQYDPLIDLETQGEAYRMWREDIDPKNPLGVISLR